MITKTKNLLFIISFIFSIHISAIGQFSIESSFVLSLPVSDFSNGINRVGISGCSLGLFKNSEKYANINYGVRYTYLPYDLSYFHNFMAEQGYIISERHTTRASFSNIQVVLQKEININSKRIRPYAELLIGLNWFTGITRKGDAYFTADTNNDGRIDSRDDAIEPTASGNTPLPVLVSSTITLNHSHISFAPGVGIGTKIKLSNTFNLDIKTSFSNGFNSTYYDSGTLGDEVVDNVYAFQKVRSNTPTFLASIGFTINIDDKK